MKNITKEQKNATLQKYIGQLQKYTKMTINRLLYYIKNFLPILLRSFNRSAFLALSSFVLENFVKFWEN